MSLETNEPSGGGENGESLRPPGIELRFRALADQWKEETRFLSSVHEMVANSAYQQIIGMGEEAVPLLVAELRREPNHWFVALQEITGVNPIPQSSRGDVDKMTKAWLTWAEQNGL